MAGALGVVVAAALLGSGAPPQFAFAGIGVAAAAGLYGLERTRFDDSHRRSRLEAVQSRRNMALLLEASGALEQAVDDVDAAVAALSTVVVPTFADYFDLHIVADAAPTATDPPAPLGGTDNAGAQARVVAHVARTGESLAFPLRKERSLGVMADAAGHLGLDSFAVLPIRSRGVTVGVLTVGTIEPRRGLRPADVAVYEELASRVALALERVRMYREVQQAAQREMALEREIQQKRRMEAMGRLAGAVAHDFNNLLTVIVGYSDLMAKELGPDHALAGDVAAIQSAGKRAAAFTEQLLTIGRRRVDRPAVIDVSATIKDLIEVLTRLVGNNIVASFDLPADSGRIRIDVAQLEQVILNLVVNARKAMPAGGRLTVSTAREGESSVLTVRDTGIGMDAATIEHCFEPFFTTRDDGTSSGLGLATVYGIVDQAGGQISIDSTPGVGTEFRVGLPLVDEPLREAPRRPEDHGQQGTGTVWLVEDDVDVRTLTETVLTDAGYTVLTAANAGEALNLASSARGTSDPARLAQPDLLITDVVMPGLSGPELANRLTADHPGLPVLFVSGNAGPRQLRFNPHSPTVGFLAKPFTPPDLLRSVAERLARRVPGPAQTDTPPRERSLSTVAPDSR